MVSKTDISNNGKGVEHPTEVELSHPEVTGGIQLQVNGVSSLQAKLALLYFFYNLPVGKICVKSINILKNYIFTLPYILFCIR